MLRLFLCAIRLDSVMISGNNGYCGGAGHCGDGVCADLRFDLSEGLREFSACRVISACLFFWLHFVDLCFRNCAFWFLWFLPAFRCCWIAVVRIMLLA